MTKENFEKVESILIEQIEKMNKNSSGSRELSGAVLALVEFETKKSVITIS